VREEERRIKETNLKLVNKEVDEVDKVYQFATLEMREQVDHERRNKFSNLRACSSENARKGKASLQAIDAQLLPDEKSNK